jgi:hypothetical protein
MTGGPTPSSGLVQAIVNTVSPSVQGLTTDNVVLTDDQGHVLAGASRTRPTPPPPRPRTSSSSSSRPRSRPHRRRARDRPLVRGGLGRRGHEQGRADITTYAPAGSNPPVSIHNTIEQYGARPVGRLRHPGHQLQRPGLPSYPVCAPAPPRPPLPPPRHRPTRRHRRAREPVDLRRRNVRHRYGNGLPAPGHDRQLQRLADGRAHRHRAGRRQEGLGRGVRRPERPGCAHGRHLKTSISAAIGADATRGDVVAVQACRFAAQASAAPGAARVPPPRT